MNLKLTLIRGAGFGPNKRFTLGKYLDRYQRIVWVARYPDDEDAITMSSKRAKALGETILICTDKELARYIGVEASRAVLVETAVIKALQETAVLEM